MEAELEKPVFTRRRKVKWGRISVIILVLLVVILFIPFKSKSLGGIILSSMTGSAILNQDGNDLAAKIFNEKITLMELDEAFERLDPQVRQFYAKRDLLDNMIIEKLLLLSAMKDKFDFDDKEFEMLLQEAMEALPPGISLDQIAEKQGFTIEEFKTKVREQLLIRKYLDKKVVAKGAGEKEAFAFFEENKESLRNPELVNASHILVKTREEADIVLRELDAGKNFQELAKTMSLDPGSKDKGGNLGFFPRGSMVREFEETAFGLNIGEISEPIQTQFGFHIIRLEGRKEASEAVFEDLKDRIIEYLEDQERQQEIEIYRHDILDDSIKSGNVKIYYQDEVNETYNSQNI